MSAPLAAPAVNVDFADDVARGLAAGKQKTLPARWLYDAVGSALFEVITLLPEYGLTRADDALLARSSDQIIQAAGKPGVVVELGSGSGTKTRHLLFSASRFGNITYSPIDVSASALDSCRKSLESLDGVKIRTVEATFGEGVSTALRSRVAGQPAMVLFLGSTIGNFDHPQAVALLADIRGRLQPGDTLLLGADLVKSRERTLLAYNDPVGVTGAFNLNLLARINRELGGHFNVTQFAHEARYNERHSRIEMHLRSLASQQVRIDALELTVSFERDETIWTESSYKFRAADIVATGEEAGWSHVRQWIDTDWGFAETLFRLQ